MPQRVTMKQVAERAGVSASTVCRSLGADPQIPEGTRQRIRKIATELGYRPDPLLSAYAGRRRGKTEGVEITTLAYVTNFETADEWVSNPFYSPLFKGAAAQAQRQGFKLEHFWMRQPGMTGESLSRILHHRGIAGLCVAPTPAARGRLSMDWKRFSCATIGYSLLRPDIHRIAPHHFHGLLTANRKLRRLGYQRIGLCVYVSTSQRVDDLWLAGSHIAREHFPEDPMKVFLFNDETRRNIPDWARAERLEVVLSDNTHALAEMRRAGISSPGEIDFATLNWVRDQPEIAGINQRPAAIGAAAVDLIIAQIRRGERGIPEMPMTSMIEGIWVNGPSLHKKAREV